MHDVNGTLLKVGDRVLIPATITKLNEGNPDYCNVELQTEHGRRPDGAKESFMSCNTAQLVLHERPTS
jgi:hypothetical protein